MAKTDVIWWVTLIEGASYVIGGRTFRKGIAVPLSEGDQALEKARRNSRFELTEPGVAARMLERKDQAKKTPKRKRERTLTDDLKVIEDSKLITADDGFEDTGMSEEDATPSPPDPIVAKLALVTQKIDKLGRPELESLARKLEACGPNGEPPGEAKTKGILASWVKGRQSVLAEEYAKTTE